MIATVIDPVLKVMRCATLPTGALRKLLGCYGLQLGYVADDESIPGSHWGDSEAGLVGNTLWLRCDTPVHSALHEACHYVCMTSDRRADLHTDAGGDDLEECAVCYLQVLLADQLEGMDRKRLLWDMDVWRYSFRLGSARAWFYGDAEDARLWLLEYQLVDSAGRVTFRLRQS